MVPFINAKDKYLLVEIEDGKGNNAERESKPQPQTTEPPLTISTVGKPRPEFEVKPMMDEKPVKSEFSDDVRGLKQADGAEELGKG